MPARACHDWVETLRRDARSHLPLWVGLSGGLDSTVLLHALAQDPELIAAGLRAIHVDHGLQADSAAWAQHCQRICQGWQVPLTTHRVQVPASGQGPEAAARAARYAAFAATLPPGATLALAQHRDDQAETVLLRLLRGSASAGMAGMASERDFGEARLWRPLLAITRAELLAYAQQHGLSWLDDPSNADTRMDRNFLRHQVLPLIRQRWPQADAALAASARWLREDADLLAQEAQTRLARVQGQNPATLQLDALLAQPPAWRSRLLRHWVASLGMPPLPPSAVAQMLGSLVQARADALPSLEWAGAVIRRWQGHYWAEWQVASWPPRWEAHWDGRGALALPDGRRYELAGAADATAAGPYRVTGRRGGERLRQPGRAHRSELKTLLQAAMLPPWQRERLPLLHAADGELLAAGEVAISARLQTLGLRWQACPAGDPLAH